MHLQLARSILPVLMTATHQELAGLAADTKKATTDCKEFSKDELGRAVASLVAASGSDDAADWSGRLTNLLASSAHRPHKQWETTEAAAVELQAVLSDPSSESFRQMFQRVLEDGNWDAAVAAAECRPAESKPWVVLVTGVNGIRKTSSAYQPWFKQALAAALGPSFAGAATELPDGNDSFFRQLDYMIATVALEDFRSLYEVTDIALYAAIKDSIFARYRTYAEMLGALLVRSARQKGLNVMVETSGRDIAMFRYIDHFFPEEQYRKMVVHFTVNDIAFAERSVDSRMLKEMSDGADALLSDSALRLIKANAGGPYGSAVLRGVQADSDAVWETVRKGGDAGATWYKASIEITAHEGDKPWTARAVNAAGEPGETYAFGAPRA